MSRYNIDIKVIGFIPVLIDANSAEEAIEKANKLYQEVHMNDPISDLRWASTIATIVTSDNEGGE